MRWTEQTARKADEARAQLRSRFQSSGGSRVVVTGANGLLGRALVRRLLQNGELVRLFVRRVPPPEIVHHPQVEVVLGDLGDPRAVDGALAGATVVFHLGAALTGGWEAHEAGTIVGTRNVVEACLKHDVPRLIHVSSLSVIDCAGIPSGQTVNEDSPLEPSPHRRGFYTRAKLAAERIVSATVKERRLRVVVLRPGRIWSEESAALSAAVGVRVARWLVVVGDATQRLPLVHVEDVVEGLIMARHGQHADGRVYQLVDDEAPSREEMAVLHARGRDPNLAVVHVPMTLACFIALGCELLCAVIGRHPPVSSYRLRSAYAPLTFDSRRARDELGWQPRVRSGAALRQLFPAVRAHGSTAGVGERT